MFDALASVLTGNGEFLLVNQDDSDSVGDEDKSKLNSTEWLLRRKEQIARASRKAREKRKSQVNELQEENHRLKKERAAYLAEIQELNSSIMNMRSKGQSAIQIENELLLKQLEEHKRFISGCIKLQVGIPTSGKTFKHMHVQGTSFAKTFAHSLVSNSGSWNATTLEPKYFTHLKPGIHVTSCHQFISEPSPVLHLRMDKVADLFYSQWTDKDAMEKGYCLNEGCNLTKLDIPDDTSENLEVYSFSEEQKDAPDKMNEWIFLITREREDMVKSTLALPMELTPSLVRGDCDEPPVQTDKRKRRKIKSSTNKDSTLGTFGKSHGWIMARSNTRHVPIPNKEGYQRIESLLMEGVLIWQQGIIREDDDLEASFIDCKQTEQLVEREMCTRVAIVLSIPKILNLNILKSYHDVVSPAAVLTEHYSAIVDNFFFNLTT